MLRLLDNSVSQRRLTSPLINTRYGNFTLETYLELLDRLSALAWLLPADAPKFMQEGRDEVLRQRQSLSEGTLMPPVESAVESLLHWVSVLRTEVYFFQPHLEAIRQYLSQASTMWHSVSLENLLQSTIALMEPACEAQGVRVNYHAETEMPLLKANPTRLQQAVMAVLFNSLQAMRDTGGSITLSTIAILDRFGRTNGVQLSIEDTGKGILAEDIEAIYQPLYTTHPRPDSVGMGLTFAERFVLEVQGRLELYSTPGIGTCATLLLPCLYIADIPTDANNPSDALQKTRAFLRKVA